MRMKENSVEKHNVNAHIIAHYLTHKSSTKSSGFLEGKKGKLVITN